jgi:hypothetical protein
MSFNEFIENYKKTLTNSSTLEELLKEARQNYRIQKLLVAYMMKDRITFEHMRRLSKTDPFASKLIKHAKATVFNLMEGKMLNTLEMKNFLMQLNEVTHFLNEEPESIEMEEWEFAGYSRMLNSYLLNQLFADPDKQKERNYYRQRIDWNNLIIPNS